MTIKIQTETKAVTTEDVSGIYHHEADAGCFTGHCPDPNTCLVNSNHDTPNRDEVPTNEHDPDEPHVRNKQRRVSKSESRAESSTERRRPRKMEGNMNVFLVTNPGDSPAKMFEVVNAEQNNELERAYAAYGYTSQSLEVEKNQFKVDVLPGLVEKFKERERADFQSDLPETLRCYEDTLTEEFEESTLPASVKKFDERLIGIEDAAAMAVN